jgi:hypothetical protein
MLLERDLVIVKQGVARSEVQRCLALELTTWSHWKPSQAMAKSQI